MSALRNKALVYLGLRAGEDEYDDYGYEGESLAPVTNIHEAAEARTGALRAIKRAEGQPAVAATDLRRIQTIKPRTYNDARLIGEAFRTGIPVIMNLTEMSDADAKRLVDFSAGLSFGLRGSIERVTTSVFLLSPAHVEIAVDSEPGSRDQSFYDHR